MDIPPQLLEKIDESISHYPVKRSASLPLLHLFQEHFGYISEEAICWIAEKLELQPIHITELVTFYPMFRREPAGRHHIRICRTLSCMLAGAAELKAKLNEAADNSDGRFSLEWVECLASCGTGPVMMVNDDFYEAVTAEKIPNILSKYK